MSSALAIASITAIIRNLLENGLVDVGVVSAIGGDVTISALPPDRIVTGSDERPQLNLFLHQVTPNTGLRSLGRAIKEERATHPTSPTLALDLHYLLTAYGAQDLQIEILIGYAIQIMQRSAVLKRAAIRAMLQSISAAAHGGVMSPGLAALADSNLAEQVEQITIVPQFLHTEELSRIWSALQSRYRPSVAYKVSVVLIEGAT